MIQNKTKLLSYIVGSVLVCIVLSVFVFFNISCGGGGGDTPTPTPSDVTVLKITNTGASEVTIGFVNAAIGGACPDEAELLTAKELSDAGWCTSYEAGVDGAGKCLKTLGAAGSDTASTTVPNADGKCISGSFGTGGFAGCQTATYPNGWTQGEFTLNPKATTQEAVDISGVNGINYAISIVMGSGWYYEDGSTIASGGTVGPNGALDRNVGIKGVYPNSCTDCIRLVGTIPCAGLSPEPPSCQAARICNVFRDTTFGGTVEFEIGEIL